MKTFKNFLVLLVLVVSIAVPMRTYASSVEPKDSSEDETEEFAIDGMYATVRYADSVNMRSEPSSSSELLTTIPAGEHFEIVDQNRKWFKVNYNSMTGYVFWKYISFEEEDTSTELSNIIGHSIIQYKSSENRDTNMKIACDTINGLVLKPGDTFRWSKVVGKTTAKKGYLTAPVIINKKPAQGLGGGVCQVSTTLYNALRDTSIVPDELHKHSIGSAYAENDATVAYGSKDFAFTNSYDYPIEIVAHSYKAVVEIKLLKIE